MTDLLMVDGAYLRDPDPAVKALGTVIAWSLYVSGQFAVPAGYARTVRADGYAPIPNYERGIWELVSDRPTGQAAARIALADTIRAGFPNDGTIMAPFSVDVNVDPTRYHQVADAFSGIHDIIGGQYLVSAYGQGDLLRYLAQNRLTAAKGWLSESGSFPGFDVTSPYVCLAQNHDSAGNWRQPPAGMDISTITDLAALHAWWPDNSPYGADMTPAQEAKLDKVLTLLAALPADVWAADLQSVDATGKPDSGIHPAKLWITDAAQSTIAAVKPAADAAGQGLVRIAALEAQVDALTKQLAEVGTNVGAVSTAVATVDSNVAALHTTVSTPIDLAAVTTAAQAGTKAALTGATIAATITPGA